jgi:hypothetical protein
MRFAVGVLAAGAFTGCTKEEQDKVGATVKSAYEDSKVAVAKAWDNVKDYTFEKRDEFSARTNAITADMDVQISEVRANFADAIASASRKAAMEELKNAEADYKDKLTAVANATADTWESAKNNLILAWDRLQAAYYRARAELSQRDVADR